MESETVSHNELNAEDKEFPSPDISSDIIDHLRNIK